MVRQEKLVHIFNRDDAFLGRHFFNQRPGKRGFARAGLARDDGVLGIFRPNATFRLLSD